MRKTAFYLYNEDILSLVTVFIYLKLFKKSIKNHKYIFKFVE